MSLNIDIKQAKKLHAEGNASLLHGRFDNGLLKAAVYGANDGIITTFAVVAGVAGAGLSPSIILILGIANMIADAISMALGDFLGERSERRHLKYQYKIEQWEVKNIPHEEKAELISFFEKRGVSGEEAKDLAKTITKYPQLWTELGFIDEMGVVPEFKSPLWKTGAMTFCAFVLAGSLPLVPYVIQLIGFPISSASQFPLSIIATLGALFFTGSLRTFITKGKWWANGLEMLIIGTVAAAAAYFLGDVIGQMVNP